MERWTRIRLDMLRGEGSKSEILRREGIQWETLKKIEIYHEPPGYRTGEPHPKPKIGPYLEQIAQIIESDKKLPKKQRHTAVREIQRIKREVYLPPVHHPGEAQVDFGCALVQVAGQLRKVTFFVMVLPYSDEFFVMAFERECTESHWEGHALAFEFFGMVPSRVSCDNTRVLVTKIVGRRTPAEVLTEQIIALQLQKPIGQHAL